MSYNELLNHQTERNQRRQQSYYQKLLAYYGGTFPLDYHRRVNRGLEAQRQLRAYWREREGYSVLLTDSVLPNKVIAFKQTA